jgi:hypothetical protein
VEDSKDIDEDEAKSRMISALNLSNKCKVAFLQKGKSLIYVGISKERGESLSFLRR